MLWGLSSDPSHRKTDGATPPSRGGAQLQPRFQIDPTKTPGQVQERTLKKTLGLVKFCGDLSSDTSHGQTDGPTSPHGEVYNFNPYIFNLYRFLIDPTKTVGGVQDKTLEKISLGIVKCCPDLSSDVSH